MKKTTDVKITEEEISVQREFSNKVLEIVSQYQKKFFIHSYGCQLNVSDGEKLKGMMSTMGFSETKNLDEADVVIYNTCAVRENAEDRVFGNIGALKHYKRRKPDMIIGICGCMTQQEHAAEKIKKTFPFVDLILGTHVSHKLPEFIYKLITEKKKIVSICGSDGIIAENLPTIRESKIKASMPIMYGCDNFCTYCVVPLVRGRERSREPNDIISEFKSLVNEGYKEIMLLGQNVNSYGKGLEPKITFCDLLRKLCEIEGEFKIRFMTSHPKDATKELIDLMASEEKMCKHLHLPVQCGNNKILQMMNRKYTRESYCELIKYAREKIPDLCITSDILIGFPGETYSDFCDTLSLVRECEFDSLYTFIFSKRVGTKAFDMEDPIPYEEKSKWLRQLLTVQEENNIKRNNSFIGKTLEVLVENTSKNDETRLTGRSSGNQIVDFEGDSSLIGSYQKIKITGATNTSLSGEKI